MHVKVTSAATLPELLKRLGVADHDVDAVAQRVAKDAKLDVGQPVPVGKTFDVADDVFNHVAKDALAVSRDGPAPASIATTAIGKPLGALGLFGVQARHDVRSGANDIGKLTALSAIEVAGAFVDKASLQVKVPLTPGVHAIPLGDKRVLVDVPPGTVLTLTSSVVPNDDGKPGLRVAGADVQFSKSVVVKNPADFSFVDKSLLGDIANAVVQVKLDGVSVAKDGTITPKGTLSRPSMNVLKHMFGSGRSEMALSTLVSLVGKPRISTDVAALAKGDVLRDKPALSASDIPSRFDVGDLLASLGAVADSGTFTMRVDGRQGFVDVGAGRLQVVGNGDHGDRKMSATITGNFNVNADNSVDVDAKVATDLAMPARIAFHDGGVPGAQVGPLDVFVKDGCVNVSVGGALLAAVRGLADRFHVDVPPDVALAYDGKSLVSAHGTIAMKDGAVVVEHGDVKAVIDAAGTTAKADTFDIALGAGSKIELAAAGISTTKDGDLVVEGAGAAFTVTASGVAKRGALSVSIGDASASGQLAVQLGDDVAAQGGAVWSLRGRPKLVGIPLPAKAAVDGAANVVVTSDAIAWRTGSNLKLAL